ncbi:MAG: RNA-directed DNA polymerase [Muribaculaceae bacterium]|nr:RNA-directed DNA polymerase [Muribaculaceae bacterium]
MKRKIKSCGVAENNSIGNRLCEKQLLLPFNTACRQEEPAAGNRNGTSLNNAGSYGYYWSGSLNESNSNNAWNLNVNINGNHNVNNNNNRKYGHSVRPDREIARSVPVSSYKRYELTKEQLLVDLFRAYKDARRHKRRKIKQVEFEMDMETRLVELRDELWDRTYRPGASMCFIIKEPKKREVFAAEFKDRIVHHLYYNYASPVFERTFIEDSYSCRKGKGTHFGVKRLVSHIRSCSDNYRRNCYVLKCDIKGYFMNIDRKRLLKICNESLDRMAFHESNTRGKKWAEIVDFEFVKYLGEVIILNDPVENCILKGSETDWNGLPESKSLFKTAKGCGLPIGNLTSQLFSNVYMNVFDRFVKRQCGQYHYGRYVDDAYIVNESKQELRSLIDVLRLSLKDKLGLKLHPDKTTIQKVGYGVEFLGVYVKPYREYVRNSTKIRIRKAVNGLLGATREKMEHSVNSYLGIMGHCRSYNLRRKIFCSNASIMSNGNFDTSMKKYRKLF